MPSDLTPYLFALLSAFLFGLGDQFQALGLRHMGSRAGTAVSICASAGLFWALSPWLLDFSHFLHPVVFVFALIGLIRPSLSGNLAAAGIRHLGPTLTGTLASTSPLFGAALGVFWLGETLTWPVAAGTAGIMLAVIVLARPGSRSAVTWPLWALALPIGAAAIRSLSHAVSKFGMLHIPDPYFAGLVGFTVSALITTSLHRFRSGGEARLSWRGAGPAWFMASGICFGVAILSLNWALLKGEVVTVVPIIASAPVFTMLLSITVFRREQITVHTLLALFLVLPSVIFIVISR